MNNSVRTAAQGQKIEGDEVISMFSGVDWSDKQNTFNEINETKKIRRTNEMFFLAKTINRIQSGLDAARRKKT